MGWETVKINFSIAGSSDRFIFNQFQELLTPLVKSAMNTDTSDRDLTEKNVIEYLRDHRQCVVATSLNEIPFAAKVYYYALRDYELAFSTFPNSNKFRNLLSNPGIAIQIDDGNPAQCMHYQGVAELITAEEEVSRLKDYILSKDAPFRKFMERPDLKFFRVRPRTIYYTDYRKKLFHRDVLQFDAAGRLTGISGEKIF
jgi:nitroimidazol reductase NimA-like FMN-containing flavoprotein (pyridoxamine 5'-phosphate oxidase superfamily)